MKLRSGAAQQAVLPLGQAFAKQAAGLVHGVMAMYGVGDGVESSSPAPPKEEAANPVAREVRRWGEGGAAGSPLAVGPTGAGLDA
jgi:hypothetical protein